MKDLANLKWCSKCKTVKVTYPICTESDFHKSNQTNDGFRGWCKECCKKFRNKEVGKNAMKKYIKTEKGKAAQHRAYLNWKVKKGE